GQRLDRVKRPAAGPQSVTHDAESQNHVGDARPIDVLATDEELLVDRLEQAEIEIAGADQVGELVAVVEEQGLHDAAHGEVAADEEEVLVDGPVGDGGGLLKDGEVEEQEDAEPEQFDKDLDEEVAAKGHLAEQAELGKGVPELEVACEHV